MTEADLWDRSRNHIDRDGKFALALLRVSFEMNSVKGSLDHLSTLLGYCVTLHDRCCLAKLCDLYAWVLNSG